MRESQGIILSHNPWRWDRSRCAVEIGYIVGEGWTFLLVTVKLGELVLAQVMRFEHLWVRVFGILWLCE